MYTLIPLYLNHFLHQPALEIPIYTTMLFTLLQDSIKYVVYKFQLFYSVWVAFGWSE